MSRDALVIGVDGGGTKTTAWLAPLSDSSDVIGRGQAGPSNPRSVSLHAAQAQIELAIRRAFQAAERALPPAAAVCLAIAGSDLPGMRAALLEWAQLQGLADRVTLCNDAEPILACLPERCGVALIAGTGSFACGRSPAGDIAKVGGWGQLFGDEGSGYALAVAALSAAARAADGRGSKTILLPRLMRHFGAAEPRQLIERLYQPSVQRQQIAEAAKLVTDAAIERDAIACQICRHAAQEMALLVRAASAQLQWTEQPLPLAVAGGVLVHCTFLRNELLARLAESQVTVRLTVVAEPVAGAIRLARAAARRSFS